MTSHPNRNPIKSARFVKWHSLHSVIIEMQVKHEGTVPLAAVSCRANTRTYELREISGIKDGPLGEALIAYLRAAAAAPGGKLREAIDHARSLGN